MIEKKLIVNKTGSSYNKTCQRGVLEVPFSGFSTLRKKPHNLE